MLAGNRPVGLTPLIPCLDTETPPIQAADSDNVWSMDLLCELSGCLCLTFELGALKISKAETTI